jgi:hypothetical protein
MYRKRYKRHLFSEHYHVLFGGTLKPDNRWAVLFASLMPLEELKKYLPIPGPCSYPSAADATPSNKPLEWTGHHRIFAPIFEPLPATQGQRWTKPLRGRFNSPRLSPSCLYSPAQHHCRSSSQPYSGCRLNNSYTPFEVVRAMEQALLPTIEANRKGNLKNERAYLL